MEEETPGNEGVMSKMETDETLGHGSVCSICAGSFPEEELPERFLDTVRMLTRDFNHQSLASLKF